MTALPFRWTGEEWCPCPGFPSYEVSSMGRVRRVAIVRGGQGSIRYPSGVLKERALPLGHRQVTLSEDNAPVTVLVHRLVAGAFLPPPAKGKDCVCHKDDDPSNNLPENLYWGDRQDNSNDKVSKGRQARGERVAGAKLNAAKALEIRHLFDRGVDQYSIADLYNISQSNVHLIVSRKTWRHI